MISGGDLIASVGAAPAVAVAATASPAIASQSAVGGERSFADVMQQSTQTDATRVEAKTSVVQGMGEKSAAGKSAVGFRNAALEKQTSSKLTTNANPDEYEDAAVVPFKVASASIADTVTKDVAVQASDASEVATRVADPVVGKPVAGALKLPISGKAAEDEQGKTKATTLAKGATHSSGKAAQVGSVVAGDGGVAAVVSNVAAGDARLSGVMVASTAPQAAVASVAADKGAKATPAQAVSGVAVGASIANAATDADTSSTRANAGDVASEGFNAGALNVGNAAATSVQSGVVQPGAIAAVQIHTVNVIPGSVAGVQTREVGVSAGAVANHSQGSGTGDVTLSSYDAGKPNQLEVGLQGGAFGWMKVRAEIGTSGEVNAYLRGASTNTTDLLQAQAPKIEAYLGTQHVAVRSVQVEMAQGATGGSASGFAGDGGLPSGGGASQQQNGRNDGRSSESGQSVDELTNVDGEREGVVPVQVVANQNSIAMTGTGNWLSVRA
jgi:hypothetical protein